LLYQCHGLWKQNEEMQPHAKTNSMALARKLSKEARSPFLKSKILKNKRVTKSSGLAAKAKTEGKHLREFHLRW